MVGNAASAPALAAPHLAIEVDHEFPSTSAGNFAITASGALHRRRQCAGISAKGAGRAEGRRSWYTGDRSAPNPRFGGSTPGPSERISQNELPESALGRRRGPPAANDSGGGAGDAGSGEELSWGAEKNYRSAHRLGCLLLGFSFSLLFSNQFLRIWVLSLF